MKRPAITRLTSRVLLAAIANDRGKNTTVLLVALLASFACLAPATAEIALPPPIWTHTASACTVDEDSLSKFAFTGASFTFHGNHLSTIVPGSFTGSPGTPVPLPIVARCNIVNPFDRGDWPDWRLHVAYQDPDGTGENYSVTVKLREVNLRTGTEATVVTFNSNDFTSTTVERASVDFSYTFDYVGKAYYVQLELIRTATQSKPSVYGVQLLALSHP
jgi:hypothetical protein